MLIEMLLAATARTAPDLRRLGLVGDSVALWSRATRRCRDWSDHEERCREFVALAVAGLSPRRTVLVLGSGLVRDVPIEFLAASFEQVVLVDAVHLLPARRKARQPNVRRAVLDLTGCAAWLFGSATDRIDPLAAFQADPAVDLVISANLLSQMPMAVEGWCERHGRSRPDVPADLASRIVAWHLSDLAGFGARICLLTDVALREIRRDGTLEERSDLLYGHALPEPDAAWDWNVAPRGEASRRLAHVHRVHAYADFGRAGGQSLPRRTDLFVAAEIPSAAGGDGPQPGPRRSRWSRLPTRYQR